MDPRRRQQNQPYHHQGYPPPPPKHHPYHQASRAATPNNSNNQGQPRGIFTPLAVNLSAMNVHTPQQRNSGCRPPPGSGPWFQRPVPPPPGPSGTPYGMCVGPSPTMKATPSAHPLPYPSPSKSYATSVLNRRGPDGDGGGRQGRKRNNKRTSTGCGDKMNRKLPPQGSARPPKTRAFGLHIFTADGGAEDGREQEEEESYVEVLSYGLPPEDPSIAAAFASHCATTEELLGENAEHQALATAEAAARATTKWLEEKSVREGTVLTHRAPE